MKKTVLFISVILFAICLNGFSQNKKNRIKVNADTAALDTVKYELIVMDPGFEIWFVTRPPKEFYSKEYYEQKNRFYVSEWNQRYLTYGNKGLYESYIEYDPTIDYGLDLNYKLFYYFRYFEESNHIKLLIGER